MAKELKNHGPSLLPKGIDSLDAEIIHFTPFSSSFHGDFRKTIRGHPRLTSATLVIRCPH
jgi:hypothetical protein